MSTQPFRIQKPTLSNLRDHCSQYAFEVAQYSKPGNFHRICKLNKRIYAKIGEIEELLAKLQEIAVVAQHGEQALIDAQKGQGGSDD